MNFGWVRKMSYIKIKCLLIICSVSFSMVSFAGDLVSASEGIAETSLSNDDIDHYKNKVLNARLRLCTSGLLPSSSPMCILPKAYVVKRVDTSLGYTAHCSINHTLVVYGHGMNLDQIAACTFAASRLFSAHPAEVISEALHKDLADSVLAAGGSGNVHTIDSFYFTFE